MIYFSELKGKRVYTEDEVLVGKLEDLIFLASETPSVTKLVIRDMQSNKLIIPSSHLIKINKVMIIEKLYNAVELEENELFIVKNLLDKQIIDITGNKIVRVNDITFQEKKDFHKYELNVSGVDIGVWGILRWLKFEKIIHKICLLLNTKISPKFLSWGDIQPLELTRGKVKLKKKEEKLENIRPEDLADYLEKNNLANSKKFLTLLSEKKAAQVINSLNLNYQAALFKNYRPEKIAFFLSMIDSNEATDILLTLSIKKRDEVMKLFSEKKRTELTHLLGLSGIPIGSLITTEFIMVTPDVLVKEVIAKIKKETGDFFYSIPIYVVNKEDQLIGVFNLHELILQDLETPIYKFMIQNVIVAYLTTPKEIILKKMLKYRLYVIPIIDDNKHILGVTTICEILREQK